MAGDTATEVVALTRHPARLRTLPEWNARWSAVEGDLASLSSVQASMPAGCTVLHLAGAVGKQRAATFMRDNVEGTRRVLEASVVARASHLVLVSSIAAAYPDRSWSPYAESKHAAETLVRAGGVPWLVLRPTMVFGDGSANQESLSRLATLPLPVLFGTGKVGVQPVDVDDLAAVVLRAVHERWTGATIEVGGPDVLTLETLYDVIREARALSRRGPIHVPLAPVRWLLSLVEPALIGLLPFSAGQLAAFAFPSCARPDPHLRSPVHSMKGIRAMVAAT